MQKFYWAIFLKIQRVQKKLIILWFIEGRWINYKLEEEDIKIYHGLYILFSAYIFRSPVNDENPCLLSLLQVWFGLYFKFEKIKIYNHTIGCKIYLFFSLLEYKHYKIYKIENLESHKWWKVEEKKSENHLYLLNNAIS